MFLYVFPLLIGLLGTFFIVERNQIVQLISKLNGKMLFYLGLCYLTLSLLGAGLLYFLGENAFFLWVIGTLLLTTLIPVLALFMK